MAKDRHLIPGVSRNSPVLRKTVAVIAIYWKKTKDHPIQRNHQDSLGPPRGWAATQVARPK